VELVRGSSGVFDVHADEELVFSRHQARRFPDAEPDVLAPLRAKLGS